MSNPFPNRVEAICVSGPGERWALLLQDAVLHSAMTEAQAKYAARAINQHEAMVAALKELEWADYDQCGDPSCRWCGRHIDIGHADDCELAALLAEEES